MLEGSQSLQGNSRNIIECAVLKRNFDANRIALNTSELPLPKKKNMCKKKIIRKTDQIDFTKTYTINF